jgi:ferrous iron transport protein B
VLEITDQAVVFVNLLDEARRKGLQVDMRSLARDLGVPAIPTLARTGEGLRELIAAIQQALDDLVPHIERLAPGPLNARWVAMRLLDGDLRVRLALLDGELLRIADRQRAAVERVTGTIALQGSL